ncbi:hypothetical protein [Deferribacter desulfuricans]|uniref:hypothetical protein n=1 Tax=Deferribacter desulfuricans TaxID=197162 RepID=UPI00059CF2CF|nr:hypothetical protein [Deferribacter desulfuricans]
MFNKINKLDNNVLFNLITEGFVFKSKKLLSIQDNFYINLNKPVTLYYILQDNFDRRSITVTKLIKEPKKLVYKYHRDSIISKQINFYSKLHKKLLLLMDNYFIC